MKKLWFITIFLSINAFAITGHNNDLILALSECPLYKIPVSISAKCHEKNSYVFLKQANAAFGGFSDVNLFEIKRSFSARSRLIV